MPSTGIERATLQSLARRPNQLRVTSLLLDLKLVLASYDYLYLNLCIF